MSGWTTLRRSAGGAVINGVFETLSGLGRLHPSARPERHGLEVSRDLDYAGTGARPHRLDVWRPRDLGRGAPGVVLVHGGGFRILSKNTHWPMALMLARAGYVVFSVDYRLAPAHPFPAGLYDCATAYRWVVEHAAEHGADPERLALTGESAGANLVLALTVAMCAERPELPILQGLPRPRALLPACGFLEVTRPERYRDRSELPVLVRDRIEVIASDYLGDLGTAPRPESALSSPLTLLEAEPDLVHPLPPTYVCVGSKDPIAEDSRRLARALAALGVEHALDEYEGQPHAFHALLWRPAAQACWAAQVDFLRRHLGPATTTPRPR